jgi:hypothetical protein
MKYKREVRGIVGTGKHEETKASHSKDIPFHVFMLSCLPVKIALP